MIFVQGHTLPPSRPPTFPNVPGAPFIIEDRQENVEPNGAFTPATTLSLSPRLGQSGLLRSLSPEETQTLLGVLCGLTANGAFAATTHSVADTLGLPHRAAHGRLKRLLTRQWQGAPLLLTYEAGMGRRFFAPNTQLLEKRRSRIAAPIEGGMLWPDPTVAVRDKHVSREEAINYSRARYSRPRATVEDDIARFMSGQDALGSDNAASASVAPAHQQGETLHPGNGAGLPTEPTEERAQQKEAQPSPQARQWLTLKRDLVHLGVPHYRADELLRNFAPERIRRQIDWLPQRKARNTIAYLLAAIAGDYHAPTTVGASADTRPPGHDKAEGGYQAGSYNLTQPREGADA